MLASTLKLRPRYFLMVLAFAGDSTITRLVLPLTTGVSFSWYDVARVLERVVVLLLRVVLVFLAAVLLPAVVPVFLVDALLLLLAPVPVFLVVVAM